MLSCGCCDVRLGGAGCPSGKICQPTQSYESCVPWSDTLLVLLVRCTRRASSTCNELIHGPPQDPLGDVAVVDLVDVDVVNVSCGIDRTIPMETIVHVVGCPPVNLISSETD